MRKLPILVAGATVLALSVLSAPAHAGAGGNDTGNGYGVHVSVTVKGDVSPSLQASVPSPPPLCWWEPMHIALDGEMDPNDPESVKKWFHDNPNTGTFSPANMTVPNDDYFNSIIAQSKDTPMTFYQLEVRDGALGDAPAADGYAAKAKQIAQACGTSTVDIGGEWGTALRPYLAFPTGNPPPPAVDPETLAQYAYDVMDLVKPTLDWNPKLPEDNQATVVNLPTWLWAQNPAALAERTVTASAGGVEATVTANTDEITISSPVAATQCSAEQARTAYTPGAEDASACTLTFPRGSLGWKNGFAVQSNTTWHATWTSNIGEGGDLAAKTVTANTNIPVNEVQTMVTSTN